MASSKLPPFAFKCHNYAVIMAPWHLQSKWFKITPRTLGMKTKRNQCLGRYGKGKHRFATELLDCINILHYIAFLPFLPVVTIVVRCDFQCNLIFLYALQQGLKRDFHNFLQHQCGIQIPCHCSSNGKMNIWEKTDGWSPPTPNKKSGEVLGRWVGSGSTSLFLSHRCTLWNPINGCHPKLVLSLPNQLRLYSTKPLQHPPSFTSGCSWVENPVWPPQLLCTPCLILFCSLSERRSLAREDEIVVMFSPANLVWSLLPLPCVHLNYMYYSLTGEGHVSSIYLNIW